MGRTTEAPMDETRLDVASLPPSQHNIRGSKMSRVAQSLEVSCSAESLMNYIVDVTNHHAFIGPLKSVANVKGDVKNPGTSWDWVYSLAGIELSGKAETVRFVPGKEFAYKTTTGARSTFTYRADTAGGKTR